MKTHLITILRSPLTRMQALSMADLKISLTAFRLQALLPEKHTRSVQPVNPWSSHCLYLKLQKGSPKSSLR